MSRPLTRGPGDNTRPGGYRRLPIAIWLTRTGNAVGEPPGKRFPRRQHHHSSRGSKVAETRTAQGVQRSRSLRMGVESDSALRLLVSARTSRSRNWRGGRQAAHDSSCSSLRKYVPHQYCRSRITQVANLLKHGDRNIAICNIIARFNLIFEYYIHCCSRKPS
jgi:hypothetical protein